MRLVGTDYTKMKVGDDVEDGKIEICPHCGLPGLARVEPLATFYNHYSGTRFEEDGTFSPVFIACPAL